MLCRLGRLHGEAIAERIGFQRGGYALGPSTAHAKVQHHSPRCPLHLLTCEEACTLM